MNVLSYRNALTSQPELHRTTRLLSCEEQISHDCDKAQEDKNIFVRFDKIPITKQLTKLKSFSSSECTSDSTGTYILPSFNKYDNEISYISSNDVKSGSLLTKNIMARSNHYDSDTESDGMNFEGHLRRNTESEKVTDFKSKMNQHNKYNEESSVTVKFQYQIQTTINQRPQTLHEQGTIFNIEKSISDVMVANLFGDDCGGNIDQGNDKFEQQNKSSKPSLVVQNFSEINILIGISAIPQDEIIPGIEGLRCQTKLGNESERCYIISGQYTLLGFGNLTWAKKLTKNIVMDAMNSGRLNSVHPDVKDVHFIENSDSIVEEGSEEIPRLDDFTVPSVHVINNYSNINNNSNMHGNNGMISNQTEHNTLLALPFVLISIGISLFVIGAIAVVRWQRLQHRNRKRTLHEFGGALPAKTEHITAWSQILSTPLPAYSSSYNENVYHSSRIEAASMDEKKSFEPSTAVHRTSDSNNNQLAVGCYDQSRQKYISTYEEEKNEDLDPILVVIQSVGGESDGQEDIDSSKNSTCADENDSLESLTANQKIDQKLLNGAAAYFPTRQKPFYI